MPGWLNAIIGAAEIGVGAFVPGAQSLIGLGIGTELSALGSLLSHPAHKPGSSSQFGANDPWEVLYGRNCVGGTAIYDYEWGSNDKFRDMVFCLADHQCQDVYGLLFDRQRVQIDTTKTLAGVPPSAFPAINGGCSFTPVQQTVSIQGISRVNNVVTVQLGSDIPLLVAGDKITIQNVTGDQTLNGTFAVYQILSQIYDPPSPGSLIFTYLCGGQEVSYIGQGQTVTNWPNYGSKVYMEVLQGQQTLGETFVGMLSGTPTDGDVTNPAHPGAGTNPWVADCSCVGKTVVMLRIHFSGNFPSGLPQVSFLVHGKNNIFDPRTGTSGYSENPALCIADYLCDQTYGYKCQLGNDPPSLPGRTVNTAALITAANICDEGVETATPITSPPATLPRFSCNGRFNLAMKRGEILQNLLTSCGGRITFDNGSFKIWPAAWYPTLEVSPSGYSGQSLVVQNSAQVAGGEQLDFPMLISGTYPYLATVANGGQIHNVDGSGRPTDLTFSLDAAGHDLTAWEIESYNPVTGAIIAWVLMPAISSDYDAQIFMNYGNASVSTFQGGATGAAWSPSGYNTVLHLPNGTALSENDSSGNGNNATPGGGISATTGVIDGAAEFDGATAYLGVPNQLSATEGSIELWAQNGSFSGSSTYFLMGVSGGVGAPWPPALYAEGIGIHILAWLFGMSNRTVPSVTFTTPWWLLCISWNQAQNFVNLYANGELVDSIPYDASVTIPSPYPVGGAASWAGFWLGNVDEFRMSNQSLGLGWNATRYNNETSPSTFYSIFSLGNMPVNAIQPWGPVKWRACSTARELFNGVKGTMVLPWANYQVGDFPPYLQDNLHGYETSPPGPYEGDINLEYDGGNRRWLDMQLPFTIECPTAQQLAKIELLRRRHSAGNGIGTGTIALSMAGYACSVLDIVTFTFPFARLLTGAVQAAWTNKILEIVTLRFVMEAQKDAVALSVAVDVQESDPSNYAWNVDEELSPAGYRQTVPAGSNNSPAGPTGIVVTVGPGVSFNEAGGVGQCTLLVAWTPPADGFVTGGGGYIQAQFQLAGSPPGPWIALPSVSPSVTSMTITGVQEGESYTVQLQSVNAAGIPSGWIDAETNSSPPSTVITVSGALTQMFIANGQFN